MVNPSAERCERGWIGNRLGHCRSAFRQRGIPHPLDTRPIRVGNGGCGPNVAGEAVFLTAGLQTKQIPFPFVRGRNKGRDRTDPCL